MNNHVLQGVKDVYSSYLIAWLICKKDKIKNEGSLLAILGKINDFLSKCLF